VADPEGEGGHKETHPSNFVLDYDWQIVTTTYERFFDFKVVEHNILDC